MLLNEMLCRLQIKRIAATCDDDYKAQMLYLLIILFHSEMHRNPERILCKRRILIFHLYVHLIRIRTDEPSAALLDMLRS